MGAQVSTLACAVKDIFCTRGVKCVKEIIKELGIQKIQDKYVMCMLDRTDVGASFCGRLFLKEVCAYVGDGWVKCSIC